MRLLLYEWEAYSEKALYRGLVEAGYEVISYKRSIKNHQMDEAFLTELALKLVSERVDFVLSFDFFPLVSMACKAAKRPYAAWIFGAPHYSLYNEIVREAHNYIFCFDRIQAQNLMKQGCEHVYHLPLAADTLMLEKATRQKWHERDELSFVGTLYTDDRNYFAQMPNLPDYVKGFIEGLCEAQLLLYGGDLIDLSLTEEIVAQLKEYVSFHMDANYFLTFRQFMIDTIQKKTTIMERSRLLHMLSDHFSVSLYTGSDASHLKNVKQQGRVDYYNEMPLVFANSKININITLRSIMSGIPLRVIDIAGSGGLVMSNYQEEAAEYFKNEEEIILFTGKEELIEKCDFYLRHDSLRLKIAQNGLQRVKKDFTYSERIKTIVEKVRMGEG